jgi:uncharacterized protein Yka (UPF0111/DUF47 family)
MNSSTLNRLKELLGADGTAFFDLFDEVGARIASAARQLRAVGSASPPDPVACGEIHAQEQGADALNHQILQRLNRTFLPPFAAEDVQALAESLDDVIDEMDEAAKQICMYHVGTAPPAFGEQLDVLIRATDAVRHLLAALRQSRWLKDLRPALAELDRLETIGDGVYQSALARLFDGTREPLFVLQWRDLYTTVERAIDKCDRVGHVVERVALHQEG